MPFTKPINDAYKGNPVDPNYTPSAVDLALLTTEIVDGTNSLLVLAQGTAAAPSLGLLGSLTTGLYRYAANALGVAINALAVFRFTATGFFASGAGIFVSGPYGLGYSAGAGLSATQLTSRTTAVTLNSPCGSITMFTAAGSATWAEFELICSLMDITDVVSISQRSGANDYEFRSRAKVGSFMIGFRTTGGTVSDTPIVNYAIVKAAAS